MQLTFGTDAHSKATICRRKSTKRVTYKEMVEKMHEIVLPDPPVRMKTTNIEGMNVCTISFMSN